MCTASVYLFVVTLKQLLVPLLSLLCVWCLFCACIYIILLTPKPCLSPHAGYLYKTLVSMPAFVFCVALFLARCKGEREGTSHEITAHF